MTLEELKNEIQDNLIHFAEDTEGFAGFGIGDIVDSLYQIVEDTFSTAFFAGQPLDKSPEVAVCLDCGNPAQVCLCEE